MLTRLVALLVALVAFWSGFAGNQEPVVALAAASAEAGVRATPDSTPLLPQEAFDRLLSDPQGQAQAESAADLPELIGARPESQAPRAASALPQAYLSVARRAPYLDGPQRPPCTARLAA